MPRNIDDLTDLVLAHYPVSPGYSELRRSLGSEGPRAPPAQPPFKRGHAATCSAEQLYRSTGARKEVRRLKERLCRRGNLGDSPTPPGARDCGSYQRALTIHQQQLQQTIKRFLRIPYRESDKIQFSKPVSPPSSH